MVEPTSEFLRNMASLRKGILRKRVFQDLKGEKPKCGMEKWQDSFVMLTEDLFLAYKDANQPHDNPNLVFDATQCKVRWSSFERSSKSNVFEVTQDKAVVLFYHEDFEEANRWFSDFKKIEQSHRTPKEEFPDVAVDLDSPTLFKRRSKLAKTTSDN